MVRPAAVFLVVILHQLQCVAQASPYGRPPSEELRAFHKAVSRGDLATVDAMLHSNPALATMEKNPGAFTALHLVGGPGRGEIVALLLSHRAPVDARDDTGRTPLMCGVETGVAELLLNNGAQIALKDNDGMTALHWAAVSRLPAKGLVPLLIARGADVNATDARGQTPLHTAASGDGTATMALLIAHGGNIEAHNRNGDTPLHVAAGALAGTEALKFLLAHRANVEALNTKHQTPMHVASQRPEKQRVQILLDHDAKLDARDNDQKTVLHHVAGSNAADAAEVIRMFLSRGADVNAKCKYGWSPLHWAVSSGTIGSVRTLIAAGANVDAVLGLSGTTPLRLAIDRGDAAMCEALLAAGANVNMAGKYGETALQRAVKRGRGDVIEVLRKYVDKQ